MITSTGVKDSTQPLNWDPDVLFTHPPVGKKRIKDLAILEKIFPNSLIKEYANTPIRKNYKGRFVLQLEYFANSNHPDTEWAIPIEAKQDTFKFGAIKPTTGSPQFHLEMQNVIRSAEQNKIDMFWPIREPQNHNRHFFTTKAASVCAFAIGIKLEFLRNSKLIDWCKSCCKQIGPTWDGRFWELLLELSPDVKRVGRGTTLFTPIQANKKSSSCIYPDALTGAQQLSLTDIDKMIATRKAISLIDAAGYSSAAIKRTLLRTEGRDTCFQPGWSSRKGARTSGVYLNWSKDNKTYVQQRW